LCACELEPYHPLTHCCRSQATIAGVKETAVEQEIIAGTLSSGSAFLHWSGSLAFEGNSFLLGVVARHSLS